MKLVTDRKRLISIFYLQLVFEHENKIYRAGTGFDACEAKRPGF
jgi:hypothetical protein